MSIEIEVGLENATRVKPRTEELRLDEAPVEPQGNTKLRNRLILGGERGAVGGSGHSEDAGERGERNLERGRAIVGCTGGRHARGGDAGTGEDVGPRLGAGKYR